MRESGEEMVPGSLLRPPASRIDRVAATLLPWIVLLGIALRVLAWLRAPALWVDEAMLILGMEEGTWPYLAPLAWHQVAPWGFLSLSKGVALVAGTGDLAMRFLPLLAGIGAVILFARFARSALGPVGALVATAGIAWNPNAIYYSAEFKQYSSDLFVAVLFLWATHRALARPAPPVHFGAWILGTILACVLSFTAVLVAGAVAVAFAWAALAGRDRRFFALATLVAVVALGTTLALRAVIPAHQSNAFLEWYWSVQRDGIAPQPGTEGAFRWYATALVDVFEYPLAVFRFPWAGLAAAGAGAVLLAKDRKGPLVALAVLPTLLALLASILAKYPFRERLLLFVLPFLFFLVGRLAASPGKLGRVGALAALLVLAPGLKETLRVTVTPKPREDPRALVAKLREVVRPGDALHLLFHPSPGFAWYAPRTGGFPDDVSVSRQEYRAAWRDLPALDPAALAEVERRLARGGRVWVAGALGTDRSWNVREAPSVRSWTARGEPFEAGRFVVLEYTAP